MSQSGEVLKFGQKFFVSFVKKTLINILIASPIFVPQAASGGQFAYVYSDFHWFGHMQDDSDALLCP